MSPPAPPSLPAALDPTVLEAARRARLERLRELLERHGLTLGLIGRPALIRHLCGARVGAGALAIAADEAWLVAPDGSAGLDTAATLGIEPIAAPVYDADAYLDPTAELSARVADELARHLPGLPIGAELAHLPAAALGDRARDALDIGRLLDADRVPKDDAEVAASRRAVTVVERAFAAAARTTRAGATERDLEAAVAGSIRADVGDDFALTSNIASGERTTAEDPHATDRALRPGDLVLLDLYPVVEGYVADLTRTWVVGEVSAVARERHGALAAALEAGAAAVLPGVAGAEVDRAIRATLEAHVGALTRSMRHHGGHGIGLFAWERPWIGRRSADRIDSGAVVCLEPGLYEAGFGGLRLEGQFSLSDGGLERLDHFPDDLLELPAT